MLKQVQTAVTFSSKSTIGTKLMVQCGLCHKSFDQSYEVCPHCGWMFGDPVVFEAKLDNYLDDNATDKEDQSETYILGSANGDKYCNERGGSYGHELIRFTVDINTPELIKLFELLLDLRDNDGCAYTLTEEG